MDDIILVHPGQEHEPGWLGGELRGKVGWFPEAYADRVGEIIRATLSGQIPPDIGAQLISALSNQGKLIELQELTQRVEKLEINKIELVSL